jgi:hypothetical protein
MSNHWAVRRLLLALVAANLLLSATAIGWLVWLSPPAHWFAAKKNEPRVAVPIDRLAPQVPLEEIQSQLDNLENQVEDVSSSDLEVQLEELSGRVDELEATVTEICDQLSFTSGVLYDVYVAAC